MSVKNKMFQPGLMLYEVVLGSLRASGTTLEACCRDIGLNVNSARNALRGAYAGPTGQEINDKLINAAGREVVEVAYKARLDRHVAEINGDAA